MAIDFLCLVGEAGGTVVGLTFGFSCLVLLLTLTFSTLLTVLSLTTNARLDTGSLLLDDVGFFGFFGEVFDFVGDNGAVVTVARCLPLLPLTLLLLVVELSFALLELVLSFVAETPFSGRCFLGGLLLALLVMF